MAETIDVVVYSTEWCGHCVRLKSGLAAAGIAFTEVDLDREPEHAPAIEAASGGYRIVPSVAVGDRLLVNPTVEEVRVALPGRGRPFNQ